MSKYWMLHPELFTPDKDGRVFPPIALVPRQFYDYESDPEYIEVDIPSLEDLDNVVYTIWKEIIDSRVTLERE